MLEITYNNNDYKGLLNAMALSFQVPLQDNFVRITSRIGEGYSIAYNLPDELSVLISDGSFNDGLIMHRLASTNQQYFILQFNESVNGGMDTAKFINEQHSYNLQHNTVLLTSSLMNTKFIIPPKMRIRSIRIIFGNDFLNTCFGAEMADKFLSNYFSMLLKNINLELIDTEYRIIMDELIKEKIEHPLLSKFIYNRVMLLVEKFIIGFIDKLEKNSQLVKLKDDEIIRLIKVEALLVKDYSGTPPVIATLSRLAAMSPTKLKKDFKSMYGLPVYEYYQKNRMQRAKTLLLLGRFAVKEVGIMVGYSNLGHFAASFKKEFGVLPREMVVANTAANLAKNSNSKNDWGSHPTFCAEQF